MPEIQPGLIVNAAAYTAVDQAESEPELATPSMLQHWAYWPRKRERSDRRDPGCWYLKGLRLPMAARVHPQEVHSAHQSMHHLVDDSEWSDARVLGAVAEQVLPELTQGVSGVPKVV